MANSPIEAVKIAVGAILGGVTDLASVKSAPAHLMFGQDEAGKINPITLPDAYPGSVYSILERDTKLIAFRDGFGGGMRRYLLSVAIATYATSPSSGVDPDDAQNEAFRLAHLIDIAMIDSWDYPGVGTEPFRLESMDRIPGDATLSGVTQIFNTEYSIEKHP